MDEVCEFIRDYINGNSTEELEEKFEMELEEEFESIEKYNKYIIKKLKTVEGIILISNVSNYGPLNIFVADIMIATYVNVKLSLGIVDDYWHITVKTIIKYNRNL
jgi:hypothetical protein